MAGYHIFNSRLCWLPAGEDTFSRTFSSWQTVVLSSHPPHYFCGFDCGRMVNGKNYNPKITVHPLQEQFKVYCTHILVVAKVRSETQTIQAIYKIKVYET